MVDERHKSTVALKDNYLEFQERLATAAQQLATRQKSLLRAQNMIAELLKRSEKSLQAWEQRITGINAMLDAYHGGTEGYETLSDLKNTAGSIKSSVSNNTRNIQEKFNALTVQADEVATALNELERSKERLESSRSNNEAREKLRLASSRLSESQAQALGHAVLSKADLTQARLAIASAEALIEIKERG